MATISLLSAKGSPGVTATVLGLALAWSAALPGRSALAVDADPVGGDFAAGILRGTPPVSCGVLSLATSRGVDPFDAVEVSSVRLRPDGSARCLPGVPDSARSAALTLAWDVISQAREDLTDAGTDILLDAGRIDAQRSTAAWLTDSDLAILVVRATLPAVTAAHRFVAAFGAPAEGDLDPVGRRPLPLALVVVEAPAPYRPGEVADALGLPLLGSIPFDPVSARVHSEGLAAGRAYARSHHVRALHGLAASLGERLALVSGAAPARGSTSSRSSQPATGGGRP